MVYRTIAVQRVLRLRYADVADVLERDAGSLLRGGTEVAVSAANEIVLHLDAAWGWFGVDARVDAELGEISRGAEAMHLEFSWQAPAHQRLLPTAQGTLGAYRLSARHTELTYSGHYTPPLGILGDVVDRILGHRILVASIGSMLDHVAEAVAQRIATTRRDD